MATRRSDSWGTVGSYGWTRGLGPIWQNDPDACRDFLASAYAAVDD